MSTKTKTIHTDVHEAFRAVVYDFGVPEMAVLIGVPAGTLYNKCNINEQSAHKPTLGEAVVVQVVAKDYRVAEAMAQVLDCILVRLPTSDEISDTALLEMVAEIHIRSGKFHEEIKIALADGKFSKQEHEDILKRAWKFVQAVMEAVKRIERLVDD